MAEGPKKTEIAPTFNAAVTWADQLMKSAGSEEGDTTLRILATAHPFKYRQDVPDRQRVDLVANNDATSHGPSVHKQE